MKKIILLSLSIIVIFSAQAQKRVPNEMSSKFDLNGKFSGKRNQYTYDQKDILQSFQYEFDLVQDGDLVTGTSTIINENGDYADVLIKGVIIGNKFHFSEYEIKNQDKPADRVWCLKSGELTISVDENGTHLSGSTPSYIPEYYYPCTGGFTDLVNPDSKNKYTTSNIETNFFDMTVYPNPFLNKTAISFILSESATVSFEILDLNGKVISKLIKNEYKSNGKFEVPFEKDGLSAGILIAKLTVGKEVYSKQIVVIN
jgi:hypothetical protein